MVEVEDEESREESGRKVQRGLILRQGMRRGGKQGLRSSTEGC